MAFEKKEWEDRLVEFPGRRRLVDVETGKEYVMDISREEGLVTKAGDAFSAPNMNGFEDRIASGFDACLESAEIKKAALVNSLPQDSASHMDTLYVIPQ